jgi:hypothetical protein
MHFRQELQRRAALTGKFEKNDSYQGVASAMPPADVTSNGFRQICRWATAAAKAGSAMPAAVACLKACPDTNLFWIGQL